MKSLFLSCDGFFNTAVVKKDLISDDNGLDLLIDGQFVEKLDAKDVKEQPLLVNINQIMDAGFETDISCWHFDRIQHNVSVGVDLSEKWTIFNGHTINMYQKIEIEVPVDLIYQDPIVGQFIPVTSNSHYQISGSFGLHRCHGILVIEFYDKQHKLLFCHDTNVVQGKLGGRLIEDYITISEIIQAPKNAVFARYIVRKFPSNDTETDSFLFFTRPFFALVSEAHSHLLKWTKSPFTLEEWEMLRKIDLNDFETIQFSLPEHVYDGESHTVELFEHDTGIQISGSPKLFLYETNITGELERLDGTRVVGWISEPEMEVEIHVDDAFTIETLSAKTSTDSIDRYHFSVALPTQLLDGRPHRIEAKIRFTGKRVGELAEITPYTLIPWDALQKFSGTPLPARLAPAAAYRYESMRASLIALSEASKHKTGDELQAIIERISCLGVLHEQLLAGFDKIRKFTPLKFPFVENPKVSIVVPVHNKFAVTYNCMAALLFAYNTASFEVILVDDGSSDETLDVADLVEGVVHLRNETSQGFIRSCNRGASLARGEYIVMLNNDTEPTVRWLDELLFTFDQFQNVGLAGSKLLYPDGRLQEAGGIVWGSGNPWNYGRLANPYDPRFNYTRQVDYLSGASIMLRKSIWDEVGGFGEEYCPAYFEDTDLAFKVRAAGYKTVYAPLSVVYHFEGISSGTSVASGTKRYQEINRPKFKQKWIHSCRFNGEEGKNVDLNKDRGVTLRALVIDYQTPRPDIDAGSYAAIQEMRLLQSLGFKVTFVPENFAYLGQYTIFLQRLGIEVIYAPFAMSMQEFLAERGTEFDVVYITRYYVARNHLNLVRQYAPQAKKLFCNADLHFLRELRDAIERNDSDLIGKACKVRDEELTIMREVDVTLSYNPIEHAVVVSHNLNSTKVVTCPWVVDVIENTPGFADRENIAFLGGFGHPPNKAAVLFFINQVMPILQRQLPDAKFVIYGSNVPEEIEKLKSDHVVVEGYIEDVATVYDSCRVFIAPLLTGAGIKGKVIDALAHGTPSVLTPIASEGTQLRDGLEVLIAETAQEWADAVTKLYTDQSLWEKMSAAAREFARLHYSFEKGRKLMRKALETADVFAPTDNQALVVKQTRPTLN